MEDFLVAQIEEIVANGEPISVSELEKMASLDIARFLRLEAPDEELSDEVVADVMEGLFSWTKRDITVVDWDGAVVYGPGNDEICRVLELDGSCPTKRVLFIQS